jgi:FPC/CPF motif-containing protein YcgG
MAKPMTKATNIEKLFTIWTPCCFLVVARFKCDLLRLVGLGKRQCREFRHYQVARLVFQPAGQMSDINDALQRLRNAVARLQNERMTAKHPVLGQLNHDEWNQLHLRHAELHLSFVTTD